MKILKVLLFVLLGSGIGAFLFAVIATKLIGVSVEEDVDNVGNLLVTFWGFAFGGFLGAILGLIIGLLKSKPSKTR